MSARGEGHNTSEREKEKTRTETKIKEIQCFHTFTLGFIPEMPCTISISRMGAPPPCEATPRLLKTASLAHHLPARLACGTGLRLAYACSPGVKFRCTKMSLVALMLATSSTSTPTVMLKPRFSAGMAPSKVWMLRACATWMDSVAARAGLDGREGVGAVEGVGAAGVLRREGAIVDVFEVVVDVGVWVPVLVAKEKF